MVFPDGSGFFQQDSTPCHTANTVQEWVEEHDKEFKMLPWPPDSPDLSLTDSPDQTHPIREGPTSQPEPCFGSMTYSISVRRF